MKSAMEWELLWRTTPAQSGLVHEFAVFCRAIQADALEAAAQLCEDDARSAIGNPQAATADYLADIIRKLKPEGK